MRLRLITAAVIVLALSSASQSRAEGWVAKMFAERNHDFGTVARGSDTVYRFAAKNIYKQDIELVSVRSSCGCTSPSISKKILKTGEIGYVTAKFNTRTFTGIHGATLTVEVRWNDAGTTRRGETQLRVDGNIRGDVVFTPGAVSFESVDQGALSEQKVQVTYSGRSGWKIVDVRGASDAMEVELTQTQCYSGRVAYDLLVRVKDSASAGYFNDQLVLVTNDEENPRIPMHVSGRIVPQISVAPESVMLNDVQLGQQVSKKIIVRGKKPFRIISVTCPDGDFQFNTDDKPADRHIVDVVYSPKQSAGSVKQPISIATDLGNKFQASVTAYATVLPAAQPAPPQTTSNGAAGTAIGASKPVATDTNEAAETTPVSVVRQ